MEAQIGAIERQRRSQARQCMRRAHEYKEDSDSVNILNRDKDREKR